MGTLSFILNEVKLNCFGKLSHVLQVHSPDLCQTSLALYEIILSKPTKLNNLRDIKDNLTFIFSYKTSCG